MDDPAADDRTLWYNQDPGMLFSETEEPIRPEHVDGMVDEVADAGVDGLLVNTNMWRTNYPSDVWQPWWDGYEEWAAENPPLETPGTAKTLHWHHPRHPKRHRMIRQMRRLAERDCDYLERALARCRERGVTPGVSIRVNDQHDTDPDSPYFSDFYREHPELRLETDQHEGIAGLDYARERVREHFLALIEETVVDYDVGALELDFLRHPPFFDDARRDGPADLDDDARREEPADLDDDARSNASIMTDFLARVAEWCDREGVDLVPRVPATPANAAGRGLDVAAWADAGLIDGLTVGTALRADWQVPVGTWRDAVGETPLHVSVDKIADDPPGLPPRLIPADGDLLRGVGSAYAATDADGLYVFNFFGPREEPLDPQEPLFSELPALKRDDRLRGTAKTYLATSSGSLDGRSHSPVQVPLALDPGVPRSVALSVLEEPPGATFALHAVLKRTLSSGDLWLQANHDPVGTPERVTGYERAGYRGRPGRSVLQAVFDVPRESLVAGENRFAFRSRAPEPVTLYGVELHVEAPDGDDDGSAGE